METMNAINFLAMKKVKIKDDGSEDDRMEDDGGEESSMEDDKDEIPQKYCLRRYLKKDLMANQAIQEKYDEVIESLTSNGSSEEDAVQSARKAVLPKMRKLIYQKYEHLLLLWHYAEEDEAHQKIMETKRQLIDDDDFSEEEAIRYSVKKRRYLIQRATRTLDDDYEKQDDDYEKQADSSDDSDEESGHGSLS